MMKQMNIINVMIRMIVKATIYYYELQYLFLVNIFLIISYISTNLLREVNFDINFSGYLLKRGKR